METKQQEHKDRPPNCIWMDAGVIAYYLCDRNFDCDRCPFDKVVRQRYGTSAEPGPGMSQSSASQHQKHVSSTREQAEAALDSFFEPLSGYDFPSDRKYGPGHTWVREVNEGEYTVGIDEVGMRLLGSIQSIVMPQAPLHVLGNAPFAWLIHRDGAIALHAPFEGTIVETNAKLVEQPELLQSDPYGEGWIARIGVADSPDAKSLQSVHGHTTRVQTELVSLRTDLGKQMEKASAVGVTLLDGGTRIDSLAEMIGEKVFLQMVSRLFLP
ncbi:MAG: hypothetical protein WBD36_16810 [Bacteroidota bacterium]